MSAGESTLHAPVSEPGASPAGGFGTNEAGGRSRTVGREAQGERFDVLIVGGGPAGSTCARASSAAGLSVAVLDKAVFPRDKVCAGWVTPAVMETLGIDLDEYVRPGPDGAVRTLQPITAFRTGLIGETPVDTGYAEVVSYAIRRCEFDHFLLERSGARLLLGEPLRELRREAGEWVVNGRLRARLLVGAGGHFCPVARHLGAAVGSGEPAVAAQEIEYRMDPREAAQCAVREDRPELYFCPDLKGYGWVVRKGDWLNVGLGRDDRQRLSSHVATFCEWLRREHRVPAGLPARLHGHAYLLYPQAPRRLAAEGVLLIGDAAGLAYPQSGEGIRPAVESGVLAASALAAALARADPAAREAALAAYPAAMAARFGRRSGHPPPVAATPGATAEAPAGWRERLRARLARGLLARGWFARHVVIDRWFLHRQQAALPAAVPRGRPQ
jgi:geranylgeranyl reductase family protein